MIDDNKPMTTRQQAWTQFASAALNGALSTNEDIPSSMKFDEYIRILTGNLALYAEAMTKQWDEMRERDERNLELTHLQELESQQQSIRERREIEAAQRDRIKRAEDHAAIAKLKEKQKRKRKAA